MPLSFPLSSLNVVDPWQGLSNASERPSLQEPVLVAASHPTLVWFGGLLFSSGQV